MLARYPNTRLDAPELTIEAWISDTAHLPLEELDACVRFAVENDASGFVPTSGKVLEAFVRRRTAHLDAVPLGNPCTLAEIRLTAEHRARRKLRALREGHTEHALLESGATKLVDEFIRGMEERRALPKGK